MIIDAALLLLIVLGLQYIKNRFPNFLFFPKGAVLFMPPEDRAEKDVKPKKKKQQQEREVAVIKIDYTNVKEYPFSNELSRVILTATALVIFVLIRIAINYFFIYESLVSFYVLAIILGYTLKLGVDTFMLTNYSRKNCFFLAFGVNLLFYLLFVFLQSFEGVYDQTIKTVIIDYVKHLEIVFNRNLSFITYKFVLGFVFFLNFFIVIAIIPSLIKFGNWYAKTLKETQYENEEQEEIARVKRQDREQVDVKEQESRLKDQSKNIVYKLNFYLGIMLLMIILSHRYCLNFIGEVPLDILRGGCMGVCCYMICSTMSSAIEFNGSFAYKSVVEFMSEENADKKAQLKKKVASYIYYIWYHYFQFFIRLIIPLFIFLLLITWKYLFYDVDIVTQPLENRALNTDIECPVQTDQISIIQNLHRCSINATVPAETQLKYFLNGMVETIPQDLPHPQIQANMQQYTILTRSLMVEFSELLFWYSSVTIYLLTVVYIGFLRKTVYEM